MERISTTNVSTVVSLQLISIWTREEEDLSISISVILLDNLTLDVDDDDNDDDDREEVDDDRGDDLLAPCFICKE